MDRYQKVEKPKPESPINENEIRITTQGAIRNYITYATSLLQVCLPFPFRFLQSICILIDSLHAEFFYVFSLVVDDWFDHWFIVFVPIVVAFSVTSWHWLVAFCSFFSVYWFGCWLLVQGVCLFQWSVIDNALNLRLFALPFVVNIGYTTICLSSTIYC